MLRELGLEERGGRAEASGGVVVVQADRREAWTKVGEVDSFKM